MSQQQQQQELRQLPIHRSLSRPTLLLGGDRELVLACALVCGILCFSVGTWWGVAMGVTLWILSMAILRRMANSDPLMRQVFGRYQKYRAFYKASGTWNRTPRIIPKHWGK